eukprot:c21975_g6_i1.p1 GENE.c21975_g6_i1~~c21975_g6_i1.p1  ORF type:complete len:375 (+),score=152.58 c21975_g6_i1:36-1127(+)
MKKSNSIELCLLIFFISLHNLNAADQSDRFIQAQILLSQSQEAPVVDDTPMIRIPEPRSDHAMAVVPTTHSLFVFGGMNKDRKALPDLWMFDLNNNEWLSIGSDGRATPSARYWHSMVANDDGNKLYVFGGYDMKFDLDDIWRFSISEKAWLKLSPKGARPLPRDRHSMVFHRGDVIIFGGYIGTYANDLWKYSVVQDKWIELTVTTGLPPKRRSHGASISGNKMYIFGGFNGDRYFSDLWEFDFAVNIWTEIRTEFRPAKRGTVLLSDSRSALFAFGGFDGTRFRSDLWKHQAGDGWKKLQPKFDDPADRASHTAAFHKTRSATDKGRIYVFGGKSDGVFFNNLFKYEISSNQWREILPLTD